MSDQVKKYQCLEQIQNDLYDYVYEHENFEFEAIEKIFLSNLLKSFNRTQVAELTGLCYRTLGSKRHQHGLFAVPKNNFVLLKDVKKGLARQTPGGLDPACGNDGVPE